MGYLKHKPGSIEELVAKQGSYREDSGYQKMFKKELDKAGKGIGSMSPAEKKAFFNKIDKKHSAKNEDSKKVQRMNVKKASGEKLKESVELEEGGVKDFLMDVEDDAGSMSLNDLIKKYYGQMGLSAQEIKKIYYRVNEEKEVKDNPTLQESIMDVWSKGAEQQEKIESEAKWLKTEEEEKKSLNEEKIKCPNCRHMNDAGADKCANCGYDLSKKEGKHDKKKAMTGSPSTKVDVKPEVDFDGK